MKDVEVEVLKRPKLTNPVFIEGLPGVGNVGKLAAEHLIDELGATKMAEVRCKDFPPQIFVLESGLVRLVNNEMFYWKAKKDAQRDLILLVGDYQPMSSQGQYDLVDEVLGIIGGHGCKELYTLGGYGMGRMVNEPGVLGAATSEDVVKRMKKHGVKFSKDEPGGGIVGASGLFLGLGMTRGMEGACLMGETSGYLVDPKSARAVLEILTKLIGASVSFDELENKAREMDRIASQLREMERKQSDKPSDEIRYIG